MIPFYAKYFRAILFFIASISPFISFAQESLNLKDSVAKALDQTNYDTTQVNQLNKFSAAYLQTNIDSLHLLAEHAKLISEKINYSKGKADALINIARYHQNKGNYESAMETCLLALRGYEQLKLPSSIANAYLLLAMVSKDMSGQNRTSQYIDNGIAYTKSAYRIYGSANDTSGMINSLITSGIMYRDKAIKIKDFKYYDTAFLNYNIALKIIQSSQKAKDQLPRLYNNISQVYIEQKKNYQKALEYLFKAVSINQANNNQSSLSYNYGNISNAYARMKDHANALKYARMMLDVAKKINRPSRIQNALQQLFSVYKSNNQSDSSLHYYILADRINDSITDIAKTTQVMELQTKYETDKKESQIKQMHIEDTIKSRSITVLVAILLLIIGVAIWMIFLYRRVNDQKRKISEQSQKLEMMLRELHHRVKNNLQIVSSLLSLQTYKLDDEATISVLRESQQRVQAMSLIHQTLYKTENITSVNMKEYVMILVETLLSSYGYDKNEFDLNINIEKEVLDVDKALPVGLIINELVTNCMKYAYADVTSPYLKIALTQIGGTIELVIKDNGKGLDEKLWKQKSSSFGKQLITALGKQLRAKQTILIDQGTQFTIAIPV